jgi:hypothetical protein
MAQSSIGQRFLRSITHLLPYRTRQRLLRFARDIRSLPERLQPGSRPLPWSCVHDVGGGGFYGVGRIIRDKLIAEARQSGVCHPVCHDAGPVGAGGGGQGLHPV